MPVEILLGEDYSLNEVVEKDNQLDVIVPGS